jgi:hypothetical protein
VFAQCDFNSIWIGIPSTIFGQINYYMKYIQVKLLFRITNEPHHDKTATSMDPDQPSPLSSLIRIHAVCLPILLQVEKLIANSMDPDQTVLMRRLVWIHAGCKPIMLVLS